jgi:hypothetical protein
MQQEAGEEEQSSIDEDDEDDYDDGDYPYDWLDSMAKEGSSPGVVFLDQGADTTGSTAAPRVEGPRPRGSCGNEQRRGAPEPTGVGPLGGYEGILTPGDDRVTAATPSAQRSRGCGDQKEALPYDSWVGP